MRTLVGRIRARRGSGRPPDRHPGRPAGPEAARRQVRRRQGSADAPARPSRSTTIPSPATPTASTCRIPKSSSSVEAGHRLLIDDGKLQLKAVKATARSIDRTVVAGTKISDKKGVSLPDTVLPVGALTEKDRADLDAVLATEASTGSRCPSCSGPKTSPKCARSRAAAPASWPRSKSRRPSSGSRRSSSSPTRSWSPAATSASKCRSSGARPPEAHDPRRPPLRQAGGRRHADAGIDDHRAGADPRRSLRRLDRRVRRRRRHHAVGRIRLRRTIRSKPWR